MNFEEIREFQTAQQNIVVMIGAFLEPLESFNNSIVTSDDRSIDLTGVKRLQLIVTDFMSKASKISQFCTKYHYPTYQREILRPASRIESLLGNQTLPSKQLDANSFKGQLETHIEGIGETMIAIAQIVITPVDVNIKANNSFAAYCFISSMMDSTREELIIIDPYIDQSIFIDIYTGFPKEARIKIVSDNHKLTRVRLNEFEAVEVLFKSEYPNYTREDRSPLHDRYLINESNAYSLGGSIKDAAKKSDYSITQLIKTKRATIYEIYA